MKTVVLFDPGIRSLNKGDEIIMRSAEYELRRAGLLENSYVIHSATHAPVVTFYQNTAQNPRIRVYDNADLKLICGSNLLWKNLLKPRPVFNVNLWNCRPYRDSTLMGVGVGQADSRTNLYTKMLYSKILKKDALHSTRDDAAADFLTSLGYKAIDTGCPTMWRFTPDFCSGIPAEKAENVIFTLTDYGKDRQYDQMLIDALKRHYKRIYFWIQGVFDLEYLESFENTDGIETVPPSVDAYSEVLSKPDIEYVGTRLHAGMFAMQHKKRTIILAIDNRVRDMKKVYDLHVIERKEIDKLDDMIESFLPTDIRLKQENIDLWLSQFA